MVVLVSVVKDSTDKMDFNVALEKVGDFGLYQKLLCALLVIPSASCCALVYFTQFFIILVPEQHWCRPLENSCRNISSSGDTELEKCHMYNDNITCSSSVDFIDFSNRTLVACRYGWIYDFTELYPTIATELNWVCEHESLPYTAQTIFFIGTCLGSVVLGLIADRFGRKPSIICSYILALTGGLASAFASDFYTFVILRFFVGASIIPLSEDPYVLSLEYIGVERRTLSVILWVASYITFSAICPWIAYGISNWRLLCVVTSIPLLIVLLGGMWIPESSSWLLTRGRYKEAIVLLKKVAKVNGRDFPEEFEISMQENDTTKCQESENVTFLDLFRTPQLRKISLLQAMLWFSIYTCYHTNTQNASNLGKSIYESFTYGALVEIPAMFIVMFGIDRLGRRWPIIVMSVIASIAGVVTLGVPSGNSDAYLALALMQRICITANYNIMLQYSAELYPTVLRGRGLAFLRLMGTLGLFLSPSIVYLGLTYHSLPLTISGGVMFLVTIYAFFSPETLGQHLPHSIEDGENFGKDQRSFDCPCITMRSPGNVKERGCTPEAV